MRPMQLTFSGTEVFGDNVRLIVPYPVAYASALGSRAIVLYDPDSHLEKFGQFKNLVALTFSGEEIWEAELPTNASGDCYYEVVSVDPLRARSVKSFECTIDPITGRILEKTFLK